MTDRNWNEKWADTVQVDGFPADQAAAIAAGPISRIDDHLGVGQAELPMTETQIEIIGETINALNLLRKKLNLKPLAFSLERFHILSRKNWKRLIAPISPACDAVSLLGHCYLTAKDNKRLAFDLSHELAHAASYLSVRVTADDSLGKRLIVMRNGLARFRTETRQMQYYGLNEGVTELIAMNLRIVLGKISKTLNGKERQWLDKNPIVDTYNPHLELVCDLSDWLGRKENVPASQIKMVMIEDYMVGSAKFLKLCRQHGKNIISLLREMDDSIASAWETSKNFRLAVRHGGD